MAAADRSRYRYACLSESSLNSLKSPTAIPPDDDQQRYGSFQIHHHAGGRPGSTPRREPGRANTLPPARITGLTQPNAGCAGVRDSRPGPHGGTSQTLRISPERDAGLRTHPSRATSFRAEALWSERAPFTRLQPDNMNSATHRLLRRGICSAP